MKLIRIRSCHVFINFDYMYNWTHRQCTYMELRLFKYHFDVYIKLVSYILMLYSHTSQLVYVWNDKLVILCFTLCFKYFMVRQSVRDFGTEEIKETLKFQLLAVKCWITIHSEIVNIFHLVIISGLYAIDTNSIYSNFHKAYHFKCTSKHHSNT